ncbi:MAG: MbcA/ParS/Xre antitoxin family protein [Gammaproteobacteria bacterium SHHR-1]|uniref:antitoxin Xre/MbcA/ParS toxin-binding domain-containing protein n=1 Tax=Magnetovirga frankeli TaxID=947516 RepID=UPI001292D595|nr:DUF2384 domain-containing protein [gamma proteobacterium SS-5]
MTAEQIVLQTTDERMGLTRATMQVLDNWGLDAAQMHALLAMPETVRKRAFNGFRNQTPFPADPVVEKRAGYVLRIAEALRTSFPTNPKMGGRWLRQGHRRFGNQSPLSVMLQGEDGLVAILAQVDCTFAWDQSGSRAH